EAKRLGIEQIENVPGQLIVVDEGNERLTLNGIERVNVHDLKFAQRIAEAFVGAVGFLLGFLMGDDGGSVGPAGTIGQAFNPAIMLQSLQGVFAQGSKDG